LIALLIVGWSTPAKVISLAIYGVSLIAMFSASATYHMVRVKDKVLEIFRKIDHAAIFLLIAGTYTPFCVNAFTGFWKWGMLSIIWSLAIIGIVVKVFYIRAPRWLNAGIYVFMGWLCVTASGQLLAALPNLGVRLVDHRRSSVHTRGGRLFHKDLQLQTWCVRLS
jgi:hemolysin III